MIISSSCKRKSENKISSSTLISKECDNTRLKSTIGILTFGEAYEFGDTLRVYNKSNNIIDTVIVTEEGHSFLDLDCVSNLEDKYKVRYGDGIAYINKTDKVELQKWEDYLIYKLVDFNFKKNPIKQNNTEISKEIKYNPDEFYRIIKINGDWAKIDWGDSNNRNSGWIKWREGNCLLIEIFDMA
jgi:hypothetical protein